MLLGKCIDTLKHCTQINSEECFCTLADSLSDPLISSLFLARISMVELPEVAMLGIQLFKGERNTYRRHCTVDSNIELG